MPERKLKPKRSRPAHSRDAIPGARGDVIIANVGKGASDVIVGKNIIKIGRIQVPTWPVVATLLAVIFIAAWSAWIYFVPDKMTGKFRVAVAEFGEADGQGQLSSSKNGSELSQTIFKTLEGEFQNLPTNLRQDLLPEIWHDSRFPFQQRRTIGVISGEDVARKKAAELQADILIYGNFAMGQEPAAFVPKFYVARLRGESNELDEIVGAHELGSPIPVRRPLNLTADPVARVSLNNRLGARIAAFSQLTAGILYDLLGDTTRALGVFKKLETQSDWEDSDGKEVLYYFIGKQYLSLNQFADARADFERAVALNPNYARAQIGLGTISYQKAQALEKQADRLKAGDLENAISQYQKALTLAASARDRPVELAAHFALGTAYRLKGEAYIDAAQFDSAMIWLDQAIQEVEAGLKLISSDQYRLLGIAYATLGTAYHEKAHTRVVQGDVAGSKVFFEQARAAYDQCIKTADAFPEDKFLADKVKGVSCVPYKKIVEDELAKQQTKP